MHTHRRGALIPSGADTVEYEAALLYCFAERPYRRVEGATLRRALVGVGLSRWTACLYVARSPLLVPAGRDHYRLARRLGVLRAPVDRAG